MRSEDKNAWIHAHQFTLWDYCHTQYHGIRILGWTPHENAQGRMALGTRKHARRSRLLSLRETLQRLATLLIVGGFLILGWLLLSGQTALPAHLLPRGIPSRNQTLALAILLLALAAGALVLARWIGARSHVPAHARLFATDHGRPGKRLQLRSPRLRLTAIPDEIFRLRGPGFWTRLAPAEYKSGRSEDRPFPGHVLQVLAALAILIERHPRRAARVGYLYYGKRNGPPFEVPWSPENQALLARTLDRMRSTHALPSVPRNHDSPRRCERCSVRNHCPQRLA